MTFKVWCFFMVSLLVSVRVSGQGNARLEDGEYDFRLDGKGGQFGSKVSSAGDVNGDGFDDFMIGIPNKYTQQSGMVNIYFGGIEIDTIADMILSGKSQLFQSFWDLFGHSIAKAGDVNNDGYDDIIVGNYRYNTNRLRSQGIAYVFFGGPHMDGIADIVMKGFTEFDEEGSFGY